MYNIEILIYASTISVHKDFFEYQRSRSYLIFDEGRSYFSKFKHVLLQSHRTCCNQILFNV